MNKKTVLEVIYDREVKGLSYRILGEKYNINHNRIYRMVKSNQKKQQKQAGSKVQETIPGDELKRLKEENRQLKLKIELQDRIIAITSKELGVDIRKKPGTRQS